MGEVVALFNRFGNGLFDGLLWLCRPLGERGQLLWVSLVLGAVVASIFRGLVNRPRLEGARDRLRAALLEVWFFRHDPGVVLSAEQDLFAANLVYLHTFFFPLAMAMMAAMPLLIQTYDRWGLQGGAPGKALLLTAELAPGRDWRVQLAWARGQGAISPPVREPARGRLVWRVEPAVAGTLLLNLKSGNTGQSEEVPLFVGEVGEGIGTLRSKSLYLQLLHPRMAGLGADSPFTRIEVDYPESEPHWLIWLTVGSLVAAGVANALAEMLWPRRV